MIKRILILLPLAMVAVASLHGCGSDTDNNDSTADEISGNTTLSGKAVKGLMSFAPISVFAITDGIINSTALIEGETGADGAYQLNLESYSGPVQLQLSIDDDTLMVCDAFNGCGSYKSGEALDLDVDLSIDFGDRFHPNDPNLVLTALVPNVPTGVDTTVQITPLTHAAALFVMDSHVTLDANAIAAANTQIASVLNLTIDILSVPPVDITAIPENASNSTIEYASLLGSLASMSASQGLSHSDMIAKFADSFLENDGQLLSHSPIDGAFTLEELYAHAGDVLTAATASSETNLTTVQAEMKQNENTAREASAATTVITSPSRIVSEPGIAAAKSLVSEARTWSNVIKQESQDPLDDLENHVRAIEDSLDIAASNLALKQGLENLFNVSIHQGESQAKRLLDALRYSVEVTAAVSAEGQTATSYSLADEIPGLDSDIYAGQEIILTGEVNVDRDAHTVQVIGNINGQSVGLHFQSSDFDSDSTTEVFIRVDESQTNRVENNRALMTLTGGASISTHMAVDLNAEIDDANIDIAILGVEVVILEKLGAHPSTFTGTLTSVVSRDLASLDTAVDSLLLTGIPNLEEFPGIPEEIQSDLYAQHFFRVTGTAADTDELLDGTLFWSQSVSEVSAPVLEAGPSDSIEVNFGAFNFTGTLSNGLGDLIAGEFEFTLQKELGDRRNVSTLSFAGTIEAQSGESFAGFFSLEAESPVLPTEDNLLELIIVAVDENGDAYANLSSVTLSGRFNLGNGKSMLASAVAHSDNAGTYIPEGDETEDAFRDLDLSVSFHSQLKEMPLARFTLSAQRTGFESGIIHMNISFGGAISNTGELSGTARRIQLQLGPQPDIKDIASNQIIISNEQGVAITLGINCEASDSQAECENKLNEEGIHGTIMVGKEQVAELDLAEDIWLIRYTNGDFESLF